jgi:HEAT repeat protein
MDDLKSSDPFKQKETTQLLGSLGDVAIPVLIDIIKQEEDYRTRKIASTLLEELGPEAGKLLKQELLQEIDVEQRVRILEIIDTLNTDLKDDLIFILGDRNPKVRRAAFQLAERLSDQYVVELLLDYAKNKETSLATAAIKCLGKLKIQDIGEKILFLLNSTKEEERLIAICRALGKIGDPASIEPLSKILAPKPFFSFFKKPSLQVRTAAAYALSQISHSKGAEVLASFVEDPDPGIRQIARNALEKAKSSSSS